MVCVRKRNSRISTISLKTKITCLMKKNITIEDHNDGTKKINIQCLIERKTILDLLNG